MNHQCECHKGCFFSLMKLDIGIILTYFTVSERTVHFWIINIDGKNCNKNILELFYHNIDIIFITFIL
jgi:hypothetical protein